MDRSEQLASEIPFNIETQYHINPVQGEWYNYIACFGFHIITAIERILVPYKDESILEMINAAKRFLSDMAIDREFGKPYCYDTLTQWNSMIDNESLGPSAHQVNNKTTYVYVGLITRDNTGWNCAKHPSNRSLLVNARVSALPTLLRQLYTDDFRRIISMRAMMLYVTCAVYTPLFSVIHWGFPHFDKFDHLTR
ncbi:Uncharacterized protein FWK35_00016427 [Aphis craccivora]|uniref:Uncharacterized protein n=1 Tax=Aphis craccivora TaxID=307492 RepID=A0A6G0Y0D0_APHCR|nr:Uncharacterized protein FWK35_00016740 [Aphis craccivora]KAF0746795.1 Uncharacterized protein FWK35_00016427 [Aphis craccivora]